MKKIYEFKKSLDVGELGENIIEKYLNNLKNVKRIESVKEMKKYQEDDIDFLVYLNGGKKVSIEVKCDSYKSGNLYYETKSCVEFNTLGCLEKTKADYIFYYFLNLNTLYIFKTEQFRSWVRKEIDKCNKNPKLSKIRKKEVLNRAFNKKDLYTSQGYTIPLLHIENELKDTKIYKKYYNI